MEGRTGRRVQPSLKTNSMFAPKNDGFSKSGISEIPGGAPYFCRGYVSFRQGNVLLYGYISQKLSKMHASTLLTFIIASPPDNYLYLCTHRTEPKLSFFVPERDVVVEG